MDWLKEKMMPQYPLGCFKGEDLPIQALDEMIAAKASGEEVKA